jgi:starch-binding outer membrane protein, SusD/RagB family
MINRMKTIGRLRVGVGTLGLAVLPLMGGLVACDTKDTLLEAVDPDVIDPSDVNSIEGAQAVYIGALGRLRQATGGSNGEGSSWLFGGLLADEWSTSSTFVQNDETDQRSIQTNNGTVEGMFRDLARVRTSATQAIKALKEFRETEVSKIAEMYFARAFAEMQMANDFCNGIPLSDGSVEEIEYDTPRTVAQVFEAAVASADSGLALVQTATDADGIKVRRSLLVTKARALLGLNRQADAAALVTVAAVPTNFSYEVTFAVTSGSNILWSQPNSALRYAVSDSVEGNARNLLVKNVIPFLSAKDPRVPARYVIASNGRDTTRSQDGRTFARTTSLWARLTSVPVINGLDARLIEAEGRLKTGDIAGMMTILNALRATPPKLGEIQPTAMAALTAPATQRLAEDLYFREKAFWQYSRGHRLGDMRRLIRQYGRTQDQVFPVGEHYRGGNYGTDVNLPVPQAEENNPELNNAPACIDRNA